MSSTSLSIKAFRNEAANWVGSGGYFDTTDGLIVVRAPLPAYSQAIPSLK